MLPLPRRQLLLSLIAVLGGATSSFAQYQKPDVGSMDKVVEPYQAGEVGVDEKPGATVPLDLKFVDEEGRDVTLGSYLGHGRPIILWLGYFECPALCDRMSGGMIRAVRGIKLDAGREFSILNVSINPNDVPGVAKQKKINYLKELGQPGDAKGWDLLTGSPESIATLTGDVGYKFKAVQTVDGTEFAHPAVLLILSPEGKVTRYLYPQSTGLEFDGQTMRYSLIEAAEGKVGTTVDQFLLTCLRYDAHTGKYTKDAQAIMKWAGALTVVIMAAIFFPLWIRAARKPADDDALPPTGVPAAR